MITIRKSQSRGYADHGWLKSYHSFSFANYFDPDHMGFGNLRVINEDRIASGTGFGKHPHRDMEIISYVLSGSLSHQDSMGNDAVIVPGEVQRMTAGTGVAHSEHNHALGETHFLQIWIEPSQIGLPPSYAQQVFSEPTKRGRLCLVASPKGDIGSVQLNANASIYSGLFDANEHACLALNASQIYYVFLIKGTLTVNEQILTAGDALMLTQELNLYIKHGHNAEVLVFELESK